MTDRDRTDLRKLREEAGRPVPTPPNATGTDWVFYGIVTEIDPDTVPPTHSVALLQGIEQTVSGVVLTRVAGIRSNALAVGTLVRLGRLPGAGWIAEVIAEQEPNGLPPHGHTSANDGGVVGWLA